MGVVYLATRPDLPHPVALKVMRPELADDRAFRARFTREIAAVRAVQGLHTARIIDAGTAEGRPYLVTEHIEGPPLSEAIASRPLGSGEVRQLARSLAVALSDIHDAGIVHRDLKPANVLMGRDGIKVIDFGIAQIADASTMLTGTGAAIGTAGYMAPEQVRGTPGPATDVFAWAVTVAHAASGRPPFGTGPTDAVIYRILHEEPDAGALPPGLVEPVHAALAKDPSARPTAAQLIAMLDGRLTAPAVEPRTAPLPPPPPTAATQPPAPRRSGARRWVFRLLTIAVILAVIRGIVALAGAEDTGGDDAEQPPSGGPTNSATATAADRVHYNPFKAGHKILRHAHGSCTSPSAVAPTRADAYSCSGTLDDPPVAEMDPQVELDPCFAPPDRAGALLCPDTVEVSADGFSFKRVIQFEPTEAMPDPAPEPSPTDGGFYPIGVQLKDGNHCHTDPSATTEDGPRELTMPCAGGFVTVNLDDPLTGWTGKYQAPQTTKSQAVTMKIAKVFE